MLLRFGLPERWSIARLVSPLSALMSVIELSSRSRNVRLVSPVNVCPFCAYGLEKRLRELPALDETLIQVSDGLVQIRVKQGEQLTDEAVEDAVKRAGFTLREIHRIGG